MDNDLKEMFRVMEIFNSIQGEGTMLGQPATFIRLAGCNLCCDFCDTKESWIVDPRVVVPGKTMFAADIVEFCNNELVIITGGEPCIHKNLSSLIRCLQDKNHYVCIETNGTLPTPKEADWVTCSPKSATGKLLTESSLAYKPYGIHPECSYNELKYVIHTKMSLSMVQLLLEGILEQTNVPVWLQPEGYNLEESSKMVYEYVTKINNPQVKMGVQLHKVFKFK